MRTQRSALFVLAAAALAGCHAQEVVVPAPVPRPVSIQIEAYDPFTNLVWVDVGVRIVAASLEWSGVTVQNPDPHPWLFTDDYGTAFFSAHDLAAARVGFVEDGYGRAILEPDPYRDEAYVLVELAAPGFPTVRAEVALTWQGPDAFASIPFAP